SRPGAYLRSLTKKAEEERFSPGPMVMALLRCDNQQQI
ncbi:MAG: replication initiation protein RepC, partial [Paracoccus sp. (in: a-proteobacteria)]